MTDNEKADKAKQDEVARIEAEKVAQRARDTNVPADDRPFSPSNLNNPSNLNTTGHPSHPSNLSTPGNLNNLSTPGNLNNLSTPGNLNTPGHPSNPSNPNNLSIAETNVKDVPSTFPQTATAAEAKARETHTTFANAGDKRPLFADTGMSEEAKARGHNLTKEALRDKPVKEKAVTNPDGSMRIGAIAKGTDLGALLKKDHGQFEVTRNGRTDRITVVNGRVEFTPEVPEQYKGNTKDEWVVKKIAD